MISTFHEIRNHVREVTRETSEMDSLIEECINLTINEINDYCLWSFLRRKRIITTTTSQEDYQLPRDVDKIGLVRQTETPIKLRFVPDHLFYKWIPNPTEEGNPKFYRLWEEYGVETQLDADDTIDAVSSSTADSGAGFKVTISGLDANGVFQTEVLTLNGTTVVTGSTTFSKIIQVSKSAATTGDITITENSGGTTVVIMKPWERSPRFKRISFYVIPSGAISIYIEYYTRLKELVNGSDVPNLDVKWHWIIREGTLAKIYQYQNKEQSLLVAEGKYQEGLRRMKKEDLINVDYVPYLKDVNLRRRVGIIEVADDSYAPYW